MLPWRGRGGGGTHYGVGRVCGTVVIGQCVCLIAVVRGRVATCTPPTLTHATCTPPTLTHANCTPPTLTHANCTPPTQLLFEVLRLPVPPNARINKGGAPSTSKEVRGAQGLTLRGGTVMGFRR